ncbi:YobI family P-loop NTPase [Bifidobacterium sp. LCP19S3_E9]|uniref:YobI family P-loop NTPase n=2 Tax=unclassified Bifidobacterium TaxID=2608897 RepID=UPI003F939D52
MEKEGSVMDECEVKGVTDMTDSQEVKNVSEQQDALELKPLYPEYQAEHHSEYVDALKSAIGSDKKGKLRNIAISGTYGSGKSSILEKVVEDFEGVKPCSTKNISLAPLASCCGNAEWRFDNNEDGLGSEVHTDGFSTDAQTNWIQREIVKQLLYGVDPKDVPLSRFHRIHEKSKWEKIGFSLLTSVFLTMLLGTFFGDDLGKFGQSLLSSLPFIDKWAISPSEKFLLGYVVLLVLLFAASWMICSYLLKSNLKIGQVNVSGASLKLDQGVDSYFDQYLDEIVYLFEKSKIETVIFEDLDRFKSPEIFDSLRELNQILNDDPVITRERSRRDGRTIRFIYAISDAVFDDQCIKASEETLSEERRIGAFSRAKFFDLIISVVPFVSSNNSYQTARNALGDEITRIDKVGDLLEDVAGFVPDQRTWITIRNDFIMYSRRLHVNLDEKKDEENALGLSAAHLLAFLIYKNCYLADAEKMREGNSKIDKIYSTARSISTDNIYRLSQRRKDEQEEFEMAYESIDFDDDISLQAGDALKQRFCKIENRIENLRTGDWKYLLNDKAYEIDFEGPDMSGDSSRQTLSQFIQDDLHEQGTLLSSLIAGGWIAQDYKLYSTIYSDEGMSRNALNFVIHNIDENKSDFSFPLNDADVQNVLKRVRHRDSSLFGQAWMLNISILNYLLKSKRDDDKKTLHMVISYLSNLDGMTKVFLLAFLSDEKNKTAEVLEMLTSNSCSEILTFLTNDVAPLIDTITLCNFLDVVLRHLKKGVQYEVSDTSNTSNTFNNFIQQHWESIAVLKDGSLSEGEAKRLGKVLLDSHYSAPDLSCLSEPLRRLLVEHDGYDFTRSNLLCAINDLQGTFAKHEMLALNQIRSISTPVYRYVIKNVDKYLDFLKESEYALDFVDGTVASDVDSDIVAVLGDSVRSIFDTRESEDKWVELEQVVSGIIKKHSHTARILHFESDELKNRLSSGIDDETRKRISVSYVNELLRNDAIWFTPMNLQTVLESVGDTEESDACGEWLKLHSSFESTKEEPEFDRGNLAVKLLNLPLDVYNAKKKESLVRSLQLESPLSDEQVSDIKVGDSKVFDLKREPDAYARLLDDKSIIGDTETAFGMIPDICWEARRTWMLRSAKFITYLSPNLLGPNEACRIIADEDTRLEPVLQKIVEDMSVYIQDADFDYLLEAAKAWMSHSGKTVDKDRTELFDELATKDERLHGVKELWELGLESNLCVRMINRAFDEQGIDDANIGVAREIIQHLDVPYRQLFNDKNRTLNTDDENFVSLIAKLNQYAKRSGITSEDIWRNPQEKDGFTKYTVAFSSVEELNEKIDLLQNQSAINN